jgi:hypothetical protein
MTCASHPEDAEATAPGHGGGMSRGQRQAERGAGVPRVDDAVVVEASICASIAAVRARPASSSNGRPVAAALARPTIDITPASCAAPITASLAPGQANRNRGS